MEIFENFQDTVEKYTLRHKSILDILSKIHESSSRINRAAVKAATTCGCISIKSEKKSFPDNISLEDLHTYLKNNIEGELCPECREIIMAEIGRLLFYIAASCNSFGLKLDEIVKSEQSKVLTLGKFNFT